jgi:hypothetical protein
MCNIFFETRLYSFNEYIFMFTFIHELVQPKQKLKTRRMMRRLYAKLILMKRSEHLSHIILSFIYKQKSTEFQDMMIMVKSFLVEIYQYFLILDDHC